MNATEIRQDVFIRWYVTADLPRMMEIEEAVFDDPWRLGDFTSHLRQRNVIGLVITIDELVVGFVVYELHKASIQIINIAVDPAYQRQGLASQIIEKLKGKLSPLRRNRLTACVRERNLQAQLFMRRNGFRADAVLKEYFDNGEDETAYMFVYRHQGATDETCEED